MDIRIKVRPFAPRVIDFGPLDPARSAEGRIHASTYTLTVGPAEFPIQAVRVGEDAQGPFAMLESGELRFPGRARMLVEVIPEEDRPDAPLDALESWIRLYMESAPVGVLKSALAGVANVLVPGGSCVSFEYSCDGVLTRADASQRMPGPPVGEH